MNEKRGKRKTTKPVDEMINNAEEVNEALNDGTNNIETSDTKDIVVKGIVKDCMNLNVRKKPSKDSEILGIIPKDSEVILVDDTVDGWFKVRAKGIGTGFCMRKYIITKL